MTKSNTQFATNYGVVINPFRNSLFLFFLIVTNQTHACARLPLTLMLYNYGWRTNVQNPLKHIIIINLI